MVAHFCLKPWALVSLPGQKKFPIGPAPGRREPESKSTRHSAKRAASFSRCCPLDFLLGFREPVLNFADGGPLLSQALSLGQLAWPMRNLRFRVLRVELGHQPVPRRLHFRDYPTGVAPSPRSCAIDHTSNLLGRSGCCVTRTRAGISPQRHKSGNLLFYCTSGFAEMGRLSGPFRASS